MSPASSPVLTPDADADRMSPAERRAGVSLASIFALRMLGLFLILPVFALHAKGMPGGDNLTLVGLAMGAYGLTQAFMQIPFGMASDRIGRKRVIVTGLLLFAAGSVMAALAQDIWTVIFGRCVQGAGAISAAVTALAADLTRDQHRTKVMAMIGSSIGLVFALSLVGAPLLYAGIGMDGIFWLTGVLAVLAVLVVLKVVPEPPALDPSVPKVPFAKVLGNGELLRLNLGVFTLHLVQMAMFVVIPSALVSVGGLAGGEHWKVYLPVVLASFVFMVPAIILAEKKAQMKPVFLGAVGLMVLSQVGLVWGSHYFGYLVALLTAFFVAFNILEASLPSLVSRFAPAGAKGAALGVYNTTQAIGLFLGGLMGGWLGQRHGADAVYLCAAVLGLGWLLVAATMQPPPAVAVREYAIDPQVDLDRLRRELGLFPGVREAVVVPERRVAYVKVNLGRCDEGQLKRLVGGEA